MPSNHTQNYQLSQWSKDDQVLMEDFNADNAKIDAAIKAVDQKADTKAAVSALTALQTALNAKADTSALTALTQTVAGKGNCRIVTGTYTGSGTYGVNSPTSLTFSFKPLAVIISGEGGLAVMISGGATCKLLAGPMYATWDVTWSGNSVSWYIKYANYANFSSFTPGDETQMNKSGVTYHYLALGAADA